MAEGKDKFDINNDQKLKEHNLDKSDEPTAKTEIPDGQPEHGNQSHVSEPTADGVIFPGNDEIHDTEERADADIFPSDVSKVELNQGLGKYVKDGDNLSSDHIAKTEILDGQPEQGILGQANGAPNVSGDVAGDNLRSDHIGMLKVSDDMDGEPGPTDQVSGQVVNMTDMHSHMDDAAAHQASSEGPPQDPQGMGLDRLGTQFDEDGMGDMSDLPPPPDDSEV